MASLAPGRKAGTIGFFEGSHSIAMPLPDHAYFDRKKDYRDITIFGTKKGSPEWAAFLAPANADYLFATPVY
jgi:hypothetical protein